MTVTTRAGVWQPEPYEYDPWDGVAHGSTAPNPAHQDLSALLDTPAIILTSWSIDADGASLIQEIEND